MAQQVLQSHDAMLPARRAMVDNQIRTFDVTDQPLLDRFYTVPRDMFFPPALVDLAYSDAVLTVGDAETRRPQLIPMVLARMLQGAAIKPDDRVLVVGAGTGYAAAIVAGLAADVVSLETDEGFTTEAAKVFQALGLSNIKTVTGKLANGRQETAPYAVIVIAGAVECHLEGLLSQLVSGGRLVVIQKTSFDGVRRSGKAVVYERFGKEVSVRAMFDASAPVLEEFRQTPAFIF